MTSTSACCPLGSKSKEERSDEEQREEHWMEPADDLARKKKKEVTIFLSLCHGNFAGLYEI